MNGRDLRRTNALVVVVSVLGGPHRKSGIEYADTTRFWTRVVVVHFNFPSHFGSFVILFSFIFFVNFCVELFL